MTILVKKSENMDAYVMLVAKTGLLSKKVQQKENKPKGTFSLHIKPDVIINSSHLTD